jgi:hypothetical protein
MMRCPVTQLSATVESMDITDRQATGTARAIHLTVNDRPYIWGRSAGEPARQAALAAQPDGHDEASGG